jgi:hypothetical protein
MGKQKRESVNSREGLTEEKDHATERKRGNAVAQNWLALCGWKQIVDFAWKVSGLITN